MTQPRRVRRMPGGRWRLLVHEFPKTRGGMYGKAHDVRGNIPHHREPVPEYEVRYDLPDTEFDELVVGTWLHVEQMGDKTWWMNVGGVVIDVEVDIDGNPVGVLVQCEPMDGVPIEWAHEETD